MAPWPELEDANSAKCIERPCSKQNHIMSENEVKNPKGKKQKRDKHLKYLLLYTVSKINSFWNLPIISLSIDEKTIVLTCLFVASGEVISLKNQLDLLPAYSTIALTTELDEENDPWSMPVLQNSGVKWSGEDVLSRNQLNVI